MNSLLDQGAPNGFESHDCCGSRGHRGIHANAGAVARFAINVQPRMDSLSTPAHASDSEAETSLVLDKPATVILDFKACEIIIVDQTDGNGACTGVANCVGDRFLTNSVERIRGAQR